MFSLTEREVISHYLFTNLRQYYLSPLSVIKLLYFVLRCYCMQLLQFF